MSVTRNRPCDISASNQLRSTSSDAPTSIPHLPTDPEALIYPEGALTEDTVELLHEFVHPHHRHRTMPASANEVPNAIELEVPDNDEDTNKEEMEHRPWHRRPSPWWLLITMPFTAIAMFMCSAPRVSIYTELACKFHRPEYSADHSTNFGFGVDHTTRFFRLDMISRLGVVPSLTLTNPYIISPLILNNVDDGLYSTQDATDWQRRCAADPKVLAAVSKLIAVLTSAMGILSCMTTAWWGSMSDRYGRLRIMSITVWGLLLTDFNFIFVYHFVDRLPGNYWFLLVGPVVDGLFGGMTTSAAASHAYTADCTPPAARSRIFSLYLGLLFVGMAIGPTFGSLVIAATGNTLSVFYVALIWHLFYSGLIWFIFPESLSKSEMMTNRRRHAQRLEEEKREQREQDAREHALGRTSVTRKIFRRVTVATKKTFAFMSPLSVFAPVRIEAFGKLGKKDWSLTFLAASYGFFTLVMASYNFVFQYAAATFGWTAEELGYWLSVVGAARAAYLTLILPVAIKFLTSSRKQEAQSPVVSLRSSDAANDSTAALLSVPSRSPSRSRSRSESPSGSLPADVPASNSNPNHHSPLFNLNLARVSLALEIIAYSLVPLASSALPFTLLTMLASCGGGFNPAVQSLALDLFHARNGQAETGRLFGALSVIQSLSSQIIGPNLFSFVFVKTVTTYPKSIFILSTTAVTLSFISLLFVRLPKSTPVQNVYMSVPTEEEDEENRGNNV